MMRGHRHNEPSAARRGEARRGEVRAMALEGEDIVHERKFEEEDRVIDELANRRGDELIER
jgi:hypothetical protein